MTASRGGGSRRPTLRDVGALAGVSFKTVARVVNGEGSVTPELAARVRQAIAELDYRPDPAASSLRRTDGRTKTVAAILEDLANPFSAAVHRAIVDTMHARGTLVLAASSDEDPDDERNAYLAFIDRRVDGVILMPTSADHGWMHDQRAGAGAVVMVDRPAEGFEADVVVADNRTGADRATTHLIRRGHRRIAFLGDLPTIHTASERREGYRDAMTRAGLAPGSSLERTDLRHSEQAASAVVDLLTGPDPPSAVFASQNLLTIGAIRGLRQLAVHREVALIGFDDVELADMLEPGVSVIAQSPAAIGKTAAEQLLARLDGDDSPARTHVIRTRLIPRGSGEMAPRAGASTA